MTFAPGSAAPASTPTPDAALASAPDGSFAARRGSRLPSLTGMRWWAALAVFVLHTLVFLPTFPFYASEWYDDLARWVPMQVGASGVAFFFVLSGFIMYWTRRPRDTARGFIWRRVRKIYPTHIVAVLILLLVLPVPLGRAETWVPCLLLIQTWWPDWTTLGGLNVPAWSLASEMLFYLLFPFVVPWVDRIRERWVPHAIAVLFAGIALLHTAFYLWADGYKGIDNLYGARPQLPPAPDRTPEYEIHGAPVWFAQDYIGYADHGYWLSYYFPVARLPEFFLGVLVCGWWSAVAGG